MRADGDSLAPGARVTQASNIRWLYAATASFGVIQGGAAAYLPVFLARLGASSFEIGLITAAPARVLGASLGTLQASVGQLVEGGVADLCVIDPQGHWSVTPGALRSQGKHTPFAGHELPARVRCTVVAGHVAYEGWDRA